MATSRTGTAQWKAIVVKVRAAALDAGLMRCPRCRNGLDWEYSGRPNSVEVDHIIPHAHGGRDAIENCRILCRTCNRQLGGLMGKRKSRPVIETTDLPTATDW